MERGSVMKYGYSNTRVKAMESKLLDSATMQNIISAKDIGTVLSALINTDYNKQLIEFGGVQIKQSLIDFALSKNFAERANTLVRITPKDEQHIIRVLISRFDLSNVKIALEAKERNLGYEHIARYIIDCGHYNQAEIKQALNEDSVPSMLARFQNGSPYPEIIKAAIASYSKNKDILQTISAIDETYYQSYGALMEEMKQISESSPIVLGMEIDMRNLLTLVRLKKRGTAFNDASKYLIENGSISTGKFRTAYNNSKDIDGFAKELKYPGLSAAVEAYNKTGQLLSFEIALRNNIFTKALKLLKSSVLSFSVIVAYIYLKEMEVLALRVLIKSKVYGLDKDEISRLITWKLN